MKQICPQIWDLSSDSLYRIHGSRYNTGLLQPLFIIVIVIFCGRAAGSVGHCLHRRLPGIYDLLYTLHRQAGHEFPHKLSLFHTCPPPISTPQPYNPHSPTTASHLVPVHSKLSIYDLPKLAGRYNRHPSRTRYGLCCRSCRRAVCWALGGTSLRILCPGYGLTGLIRRCTRRTQGQTPTPRYSYPYYRKQSSDHQHSNQHTSPNSHAPPAPPTAHTPHSRHCKPTPSMQNRRTLQQVYHPDVRILQSGLFWCARFRLLNAVDRWRYGLCTG